MPAFVVADRGWLWNQAERRWELRGPDAEIAGWVTAEFLRRVGREKADWIGDRKGWPPIPRHRGLAARMCLLAAGPRDGRHVYVIAGGLPSRLVFSPEPAFEVEVGGDGEVRMPEAVTSLPPEVYERGVHCGHPGCPQPYHWAGR